MSVYLVDSNVLLDVATGDPRWSAWSAQTLADCSERGILLVNPIIYAEVSVGYDSVEGLDAALPAQMFKRVPLPWEAAFLAGKCFLTYRKRGGVRTSPMPDFYIGAHAAVAGLTLLTRDASRFRTYFPKVAILAP